MMICQEDALTKVFQNSPVEERRSIRLDAARNEIVSAQFVISSDKDAADLACKAKPLSGPGGSKIDAPRVRYVGYVPVQKNTDASALRPAPAEYPDPLLESAPPLKAKTAQPIWVTIEVPKNATPGEYSGSIEVTAGGSTSELPVQLMVYRTVVSEQRTLKITNWLLPQPTWGKLFGISCSGFENEKYWQLLSAFAKNLARHRQNVILTPVNELAIVGVANGQLTFDFSRFDRWVKVFSEAGVLGPPENGIIEGGHLAGGEYGKIDHKSSIWTVKDGKAVRVEVSSWSNENHQFLKCYLPALQAYLEKKGWLGIYRQHVFDEPVDVNKGHYLELVKTLRAAAPKLKTIEATHCADMVGCIDVWVPQSNMLQEKYDFYRERQKLGEEVWYYTCLNPKTPHLNRFIDYPLLKVRLMHWANFKYGITGFLHWGWNCWREEPFKNVENEGAGMWLPPGDTHIVYPKPGGVLDSLRHEAMLEGIQDYELLQALAKKDPAKAKSICDSVLQSWTAYTVDPVVFRAARRELLEALSRQ
jgi:hypothetical protein